MASDFVIVTGFNDAYQRMGALTAKTVARYAEANGIAARLVREFSSGRPAAWEKIRIIQQLFREGWEYVCWIDADAAFLRFDENIRDEIEPGNDWQDVSLVIAESGELRPGGPTVRFSQPCSGFMVLRNTAWSREFLDDVWKRTEFLNHCWWELAAIIHLCGYHRAYDGEMQDRGKRELLALVDPTRESRSDKEISEHVGRLDGKWNQSAAVVGGDPIVRHYTGGCGAFAHRLALMERDLIVR